MAVSHYLDEEQLALGGPHIAAGDSRPRQLDAVQLDMPVMRSTWWPVGCTPYRSTACDPHYWQPGKCTDSHATTMRLEVGGLPCRGGGVRSLGPLHVVEDEDCAARDAGEDALVPCENPPAARLLEWLLSPPVVRVERLR